MNTLVRNLETSIVSFTSIANNFGLKIAAGHRLKAYNKKEKGCIHKHSR